MRTEIKSTTKRFIARKVSVGKNAVIIYSDDERIDIPLPDGLPEGTTIPPTGTVLENVSVSINAAGDTLYGLHPAKGTYLVEFSGFSHGQDKDPAPRQVEAKTIKTKTGATFVKPAHLIFTALLKIVTGPYKGCIVPWTSDYLFERDTDGNVKIHGGSKAAGQIVRFLELVGFDLESSIRYTENILPDLEMLLWETAQENVFQVTLNNGWVDEMAELPAGVVIQKDSTPFDDDDEDDLEDDEPPAKTRRRTAQVTDESDDDEDDTPAPRRVVDTRRRPAPTAEVDDEEDVAPKARTRKAF